MKTQPLTIIEPNLKSESGHYASFVTALSTQCSPADPPIVVCADPLADALLKNTDGTQPQTYLPRTNQILGEWRIIAKLFHQKSRFLVLTASGKHAFIASLLSSKLDNAVFYFHWTEKKRLGRFLHKSARRARKESLAIAPTHAIAEQLKEMGWEQVLCIPYPIEPTTPPTEIVPFNKILMAGAARLNKGLDLVADLAIKWAQAGKCYPLHVQISPKHIHKHGTQEKEVVSRLLNANYPHLVTDANVPDKEAYAQRYQGALTLAPYTSQFSDAVSGVVLDALLRGSPVIATANTWPGKQVERFQAGITIKERTSEALDEAIEAVVNNWEFYANNSLIAAKALLEEHHGKHLYRILTRSS